MPKTYRGIERLPAKKRGEAIIPYREVRCGEDADPLGGQDPTHFIQQMVWVNEVLNYLTTENGVKVIIAERKRAGVQVMLDSFNTSLTRRPNPLLGYLNPVDLFRSTNRPLIVVDPHFPQGRGFRCVRGRQSCSPLHVLA